MGLLYVCRHGETEWNVEQRMQGHGDSALTERGQLQARAHGDLLAGRGGVHALLVSPSGRTRATAALMLEALESAPQIGFHPELMERHSGQWEGLTLDEIAARDAQAWAQRARDPYFHRPPGGENHADLEVRLSPLLPRLNAQLASNAPALAVVTHGVLARVLLKCLLKLEPDEALRVIQPNAVVYCLEPGLDGLNVTHFVQGRGPFTGFFRR
jgi:broad specificity phosphatase PhoE